MNTKLHVSHLTAALLIAINVGAQTLSADAEKLPASQAPDTCAADAAALVGKWDGTWSVARIDAVFDPLSVYAKDDKCFLRFKLYQKTKEAESATYKLYEMHIKPGEKVNFDRIDVTRPTAEIWGAINKKAGTILINHKRPEFHSAGYAEFKKRTQ